MDPSSPVGYGWSLSIPYIQRINKTGSQTLYGPSPFFTSSLDGEIVNVATTTSTSTDYSSISSSLLSYWKLDESSGNAADSVGTNTLTNVNSVSYSSAVINNGGVFAKASSKVLQKSSAILGTAPRNFTVSLWVKLNSEVQSGDNNQGYYLFSHQDSAGGGSREQIYINYDYNGGSRILRAGVYTGSEHEVTKSGNLGTSSWYHIVLTCVSGTLTLYVNGVSQGTASISGSGTGSGASGTRVGANSDDGTIRPTDGTIDEVGIWTRGISSTEVSELYNGGAGLQYPFSATTTTSSVTSTYLPRIDNGSLDSYTYSTSTNSWIMYDKRGTEYIFGSSTAAQQSATTTPSNVYKWMLEKIVDTNGNYVSYSYAKDGNQIYPSSITYTGNGVTDGPMTVTFATSSRTDVIDSYKTGFWVDTKYRISQITATVSGTTTQQYNLSYTAGNNSNRSLLSSVQKDGWNDSGAKTSEPATAFQYMSSTTPFVQTFGNGNCNMNAYVGADGNGDGVNDEVVAFVDQTAGGVHRIGVASFGPVDGNTISSPDANLMWGWKDPGPDPCPNENGTRFIDVNGDGKGDLLYGTYSSGATTTSLYVNQFATSTGYGWTASTTGSTSVIPSFIVNGRTSGIFGDVNGTGLAAFEQRIDGTIGALAFLPNGDAWSTSTSTIFSPPKSMPSSGSDCTDSQLVDVNGDGLADWVYTNGTTTEVLLNNGTGWNSSPDSAWTFADTLLYSSGGTCYDRGFRFVDINGDGLPDLMRGYYMPGGGTMPEHGDFRYVAMNTGNGWAATSTSLYTLPYVIHGVVGPPTTYTSAYDLTNFFGNGQQYQDVLATTTYPKGGSTSVTYGYTTLSGSSPQLPYDLLVATNVVNHDGRGSNESTSYSYSGGKQYTATGVFDHKFAGFASTTETNANGKIVTYYSQGATSTAAAAGDQSDGFPQLNYPYRKEIFSSANTLLQRIFYRYDPYYHDVSVFVGLGRQLQEDFASDGTHRDKNTEYKYSSSTNDLIETDNYGEVTGGTDGTFTDVSGDSRTTFYTYAASSSVNLSVPIRKRVIDNSSATSTDTKFYYDGLAFGSVSLGNQTKQEDWITGSTYASSTKTYTSYGLVATSTDRLGNATAYAYDSLNLYPATTTDALSHATAFTYNYASGKVRKTTDPNGAITQNVYDGLARVTEIDQSDLSMPSSLVTKGTYQYTDSTTTPSLVHESDYLNSATTTDSYRYYNGLGRLIQERKSSENASTSTVTDFIYNAVGTLASSSLPYFSLGTSNTSATATTTLYTALTYDALGRTLTAVNSVGTTTNAYSTWTTTSTDPKSNIKDAIFDAFGNLAQIVEHGPSTATTTYSYDAANNLTVITDGASNVRNFTYDGLGRRLTAEDLHASGDATFGSWSYVYDNAGNLTSQTDPKSQVVTRTYDALNRILTESLTGTGTQITNTYDSCTNGIGRVCIASSTSALSAYKYDVLGRVSNATTTISGVAYGMVYGHDRQGNVTDITNANGSKVSYIYTPAVLASAVNRTVSGMTSALASLVNYAPTSQMGALTFGSGASTTNTYDPAALYRLTNILTMGNVSTTTSSDSSALLTGLVSYWKLDESSGNATDSAGSNTLTNVNSVTYGSALVNNGGIFAKASSKVLEKPTAILGTAPRDFTVSLWVKLASEVQSGDNNQSYDLFSHQDSAGSGSREQIYMFYDYNGGSRQLRAGVYTSAEHEIIVNGNLGTSAWHHLVLTSLAGSLTFYLDGVSQGTAAISGSGNGSGPSGTRVGANSADGTIRPVDGTMDEVGIWSRGLSSTEVGSLYNSGLGLDPYTAVGSSTHQLELQNTSYTYDADGNITVRGDNSDVVQGQVNYTYDSLNRLSSASTTPGSSISYSQTYTYDVLGNLQTGPGGTYSYQGNTGSSYANPDATTQTVLTTNASSPTIGFDNGTLAGNGTPASSLTFSHNTISSSNGLIVVAVAESTTTPCTSDAVTGVTYNGTSLTDFGYYVRETTNVKGALKTYYGFAPASGTHNVVVSASASCILYATAATYTGVKQSGIPDASGTGNPLSDSGAVSPFQATTTTSAINSWAVMIGVPSVAGTATAGSGTTLREQQSGSLYYGDSNGPVSPAGAKGLSWSIGSSAHWLANYFSIPPTISTPGSTATTTYTYDNNGNMTWATVGATSTNYVYDYRNQLTQLLVGAGGATTTTTYGYDASGGRVFQASAGATTTYPFKYYSIVSTLSGATTTATTTEYVFLPAQGGKDELLFATIDQPLINGTATGTPVTRYVHPDNLGSTAVTSNEVGDLAQSFNYAPYGSVISTTNTGSTTANRQFIGQFTDTSGLSYLNARYYNSSQAQFLSEDPMFLNNPMQQGMQDPQSLNAYSYSDNNPIRNKDPSGKCFWDGCAVETIATIEAVNLAIEYGPAVIGGIGGGINTYLSHQSDPSTPAPGFAQYATGIGFGAASGYAIEGKLFSLFVAGAINAGEAALQDTENGKKVNPLNTGLSFVSPALGYGLFKSLAGPSTIEALGNSINSTAPFFGGNVFNMGVQQIRYQITSGAFGLGVDSFQRGVTNSISNPQSSNSTNKNSSSGGGYGSPGSTYTNFVPANTFTACGSLCR